MVGRLCVLLSVLSLAAWVPCAFVMHNTIIMSHDPTLYFLGHNVDHWRPFFFGDTGFIPVSPATLLYFGGPVLPLCWVACALWKTARLRWDRKPGFMVTK